jgi:hypothetical protein
MVRRRGASIWCGIGLLAPRLFRPNQEWAMDFIVDGLATGRMVRILSVVDAYTRECLALEADTSLGSGRVTRVLETVDRRAWPPGERALGQRTGVHLASDAGLGGRLEGGAGAYPARPADAERTCRELPREAARRVPQRALVPHAERCPEHPGNAGVRSTTASVRTARSPTGRRKSSGKQAMQMWKAQNASHIYTASTAAAR